MTHGKKRRQGQKSSNRLKNADQFEISRQKEKPSVSIGARVYHIALGRDRLNGRAADSERQLNFLESPQASIDCSELIVAVHFYIFYQRYSCDSVF
jgi:hypothetical protein